MVSICFRCKKRVMFGQTFGSLFGKKKFCRECMAKNEIDKIKQEAADEIWVIKEAAKQSIKRWKEFGGLQ